MNWQGRKVLVTGSDGFLGSNLVPALQALGAQVISCRLQEYNLTAEPDVERLLAAKPEIIIHLAADVGGIEYVRTHQASVFYNNVMMNTLLLEHARRAGVKKIVCMNSVTCYPADVRVPFKEQDINGGLPEESMRSYGMAKRMMMLHSKLLNDMTVVNLVFDNIYGPHDVMTPGKSRVVPANIKRCVDAVEQGLPSITVWGTGTSVRDFVFVGDAAEIIIKAAETISSPDPINIGSGNPVTMKELLTSITHACGYEGEILWDATKPEGQKERYMDVAKAKELGLLPKTSLGEGLKCTVQWYKTL